MKVSHVPYRVRRTLVWVRRWRRTRGFGVHSPTDYHFIRYVVNEHWPYYAYDTLKAQIPDIDRKTRKVCKLYFRIANHLQPKSILLIHMPAAAYEHYLRAGCQTAHIMHHLPGCSTLPQADFIATTADDDMLPLIDDAMQHAGNGTLFIINGIHKGRHSRRLWKTIRQHQRATITFDLYYCGIIVINDTRSPQHYIVNY